MFSFDPIRDGLMMDSRLKILVNINVVKWNLKFLALVPINRRI